MKHGEVVTTTEGRKDRGIVSFSLEYEIHVGKTKTM